MDLQPAPEAPVSDHGRYQQVTRILRLMQIVQHRSYLPPLHQLADHLGVCPRTVRRYFDVLRAVGVELPPMAATDEDSAGRTGRGLPA